MHTKFPIRIVALHFFLTALFLFGRDLRRAAGLRGIASLVGSFLLIAYVLLPQILAGLRRAASVGVASLIIVVGSYITTASQNNERGRCGMIITIVFTSMLAFMRRTP